MSDLIRARLRQALCHVQASSGWRRGGTLILVGCAAYFLALLYPAPTLTHWYQVMPLIWFGGILVISGAVLLPVRPQVWMFAKLLIVAAAIHWTVALPIAEWGWL